MIMAEYAGIFQLSCENYGFLVVLVFQGGNTANTEWQGRE
jgi:hypothetical protein